MAAAIRAKQIKYKESEKLVENPHSKKEIGIALEEIIADSVKIISNKLNQLIKSKK